ncbi:MAG: DUF1599 domain-containing protein [Bacilli bacterium]|nr:DUF1599 domain-containing protein [Bacilli bacterium]MBQ7276521.1 DUF1599 domain-containing protein [Bacilli bacterium]
MYNKVDKFKEIVDGMLDLYQRKQADYGDSAAKTFDEWGLVSFLVRMEDKMNRVINLTQKQGEAKVADEKIEDTILDLANYSIMALIEMDRYKSELTSHNIAPEKSNKKNGNNR